MTHFLKVRFPEVTNILLFPFIFHDFAFQPPEYLLSLDPRCFLTVTLKLVITQTHFLVFGPEWPHMAMVLLPFEDLSHQGLEF